MVSQYQREVDRARKARQRERARRATEPTPVVEPNPQWQLAAACRHVDRDLFFPALGDDGTEAKKLCAACPVRDDCLAYALEAGQSLHGVWGGKSPEERNLMRRRKRWAQ